MKKKYKFIQKISSFGKTFFINLAKIGVFDFLKLDLKYIIENYDILFGSKSNQKKYQETKYNLKPSPEGTISGFSGDEREGYLDSLIEYDILSKGIARIRSIKKVLNKCIDLVDIGTLSNFKKRDDHFYIFGKVTEIRYSYKESVKEFEASGKRETLGGSYGYIDDGTGDFMMLFTTDLFRSRKKEIETLAGTYILAEAYFSKNIYGIFVNRMWVYQQIVEAEIGLELLRKTNNKKNEWYISHKKNIIKCDKCELRSRCSRVVPCLDGKYNMMIVAESPGGDEDRLGIPLIGSSGNEVNKQLNRVGIERKDIWIDNLVKCRPPNNKLSDYENCIKICSPWLEEEIKNIKPFVILSMGKYSKEFFSSSKDGIMKMNAAVEYNFHYHCWIVYSIHPASVLYHAENRKLLEQSFDKFSELVLRLGLNN